MENQNDQSFQQTVYESKEEAFRNSDYGQKPQNVNINAGPQGIHSAKSKWLAAILCFFFGVFGIHRFYVGKIGTGILWLLTGGLLGVGVIIDFIVILLGGFKDTYGLMLTE